MTRAEFRALFEAYKATRASGDKQHKRICDQRARSQSPQTLYFTPVGLMFFDNEQNSGLHVAYRKSASGNYKARIRSAIL